ncbi:Uma2 family endonuclease [Longimicrobium sp.]|uniref:Uma2 family endonuclease n=1 Tax=Longimicrobium sp. TaxID=2029185 RepID=UPI002CFBC194|nr:Uma2 family endonuclease [Longimicrobium sp.]HSU16313.1 Uma2 family endonuclease [Longimicrobium sp.]
MSPLAQPRYTPERYLALERASDHKSELINGQIYAMTGASFVHNTIVGNILTSLRNRLRNRGCSVLSNDMRVKASHTVMYTYPDVVALCEPPRLEDSYGDTLLNPAVIFEVLSESTERHDRGEKFAHYRRIESLREYILISQNMIRVERFVRHGDHWVFNDISDLADSLRIDTLGCEISLAEIYEQVDFSAAE